MAMVAGETSGDLLAGLILPAMHERWSELEAFGIGGPHMMKAGFDSWWPSEKLEPGPVVSLRFQVAIDARWAVVSRAPKPVIGVGNS